MKLSTPFFFFASALLVAAAPAPDAAPPKKVEASSAVVVGDVHNSDVKDQVSMQGYCGRGYGCYNGYYSKCCNAVYPPTCCPWWANYCSWDGKWCW